MAQQGRITHIDVAKGIAIIAMIAGHLGFAGPDGQDVVSRFVFQFHVPVFFVIAGYFLSQKQSLLAFAKQKAFRMLAPYVATCVVMLAILVTLRLTQGETSPPTIYGNMRDYVVAAFYGAGTPGVILPEGVMHIGAIWFLEALLVALLVTRLCLNAGQFAAVPIVALAAAGIFSSRYLWLPFNIQSGLMGALFVYAGYLLRRIDFFKRAFSPALFAALSAVAVAAYLAGINISIVRCYCGNWMLGIPVAISSSVWCIMLAQLISQKAKPLAAFFEFYGKNSLLVLCVHLVFLDMGLKYLLATAGIPQENNVLFAVNLALQLLLTALCALGVQKTKWIRKLFY